MLASDVWSVLFGQLGLRELTVKWVFRLRVMAADVWPFLIPLLNYNLHTLV